MKRDYALSLAILFALNFCFNGLVYRVFSANSQYPELNEKEQHTFMLLSSRLVLVKVFIIELLDHRI